MQEVAIRAGDLPGRNGGVQNFPARRENLFGSGFLSHAFGFRSAYRQIPGVLHVHVLKLFFLAEFTMRLRILGFARL